MFDRHQGGEAAVLVHLDFYQANYAEDVAELQELVRSAGLQPLALITGSRKLPDPKFFLGQGKAEELKAAVVEHQAEVVIVNHRLSPSQERNLEAYLECRVVDRVGLILDIFAQRAQTFEGKLQVELAQLKHISTRLVRGWTHLERQRGGAVGLRGPGETQLETDRRLVKKRISLLESRLDKVDDQRQQNRRARRRNEIKTVSLVGYTNAGKSTLFNALTNAEVYAADKLFATLDPTLRKLPITHADALLADTVGFIRHLPHDLVHAFRATLTESREADLLLHVVDAADPERDEKMAQVHIVLAEIGADSVPMLTVFNKIDMVEGIAPRIEYDEAGLPIRAFVSAQNGLGLTELLAAIEQRVGDEMQELSITLPAEAGRIRARLYELQAVQEETQQEDGSTQLLLQLNAAQLQRLRTDSDLHSLLPPAHNDDLTDITEDGEEF